MVELPLTTDCHHVHIQPPAPRHYPTHSTRRAHHRAARKRPNNHRIAVIAMVVTRSDKLTSRSGLRRNTPPPPNSRKRGASNVDQTTRKRVKNSGKGAEDDNDGQGRVEEDDDGQGRTDEEGRPSGGSLQRQGRKTRSATKGEDARRKSNASKGSKKPKRER